MASLEMACEKQETIRQKLAECGKGQGEIQALLEVNFNRHPDKCEDKDVPKPSRPNVLDEIIDDLTELLVAQKRTIEFLITNVNPKL